MVGDKTVALGDYLQPGTQIMAVVPLNQVYVLANYKETQITDIRPGQQVEVDVDAFPNLKVTGWVDSVFPDSGQEFALLPPDNATGNFTKIVQRVPVKIYLHLTPALIGKLRPGLSVEPSIDTRARRLRMAPAEPIPLRNRVAVGGALIGAFMAVLNIQVVNTSLPDIQGGIGTGLDNGGWISTAYLIGEIVVIPLSGWLSQVFSLRRYLIASTILFLAFSAACGLAVNFPEMVTLRALQGFFGGVLIPLSLVCVITLLPPLGAPHRLRRLRAHLHLRAGDRPDHRRRDHRYLWLALYLLPQSAPRRGDAAGFVLGLAAGADAAAKIPPGRLDRHRHHGDRPQRAADRARGRQQGRLVRLALHHASLDHLGPGLERFPVPGTAPGQQNAAGESAPVQDVEFRLLQQRQCDARLRAVFRGLSHPALSRRRAWL